MATALVTHADYMKHNAGPGHPERPGRIRAVLSAIEDSPLAGELEQMTPDPVDTDLLTAVHAPSYVEQVRLLATEGGGMLDPDTVVSPSSYDVALLAAGGAVAAVSAVMREQGGAAFAVIRPPGHHALPNRGMGFCLFNNAACAAVAARNRFGLSRICILDWDVHHGNGTQAIFYRDRTVLYLSTHQESWYPGTGAWEEIGEGEGVGFNFNIPLPAQTGDEGFRLIFEEVVVPVLEAFAPELLLISAGYDAHVGDPLGGMALTASGFHTLTHLALGALQSTGRVAAVLEGGYDLTHLGRSVVATLSAFAGRALDGREEGRTISEVPYAAIHSRVRTARSIIKNYWNI